MKNAHMLLLALVLGAASGWAEPPRGAPVKRVTLDVVKADVHSVLRLLAEVGRVNLVVADEVQGTVTLRLRDVPWTQALEVVLASRGLGQERLGNVLRVAPLKQLEEEARTRAQLAQSREQVAPLRTWFIPVNYAKAADLLPHVKAQLSPRGSASVDVRTNTLIVTDVEPIEL
jgi:type II secretory pathway component HofQ